MSYANLLDYWVDTYVSFNLHYSTIIFLGDTLINALKGYKKEQEENRKFYGNSYLCYY